MSHGGMSPNGGLTPVDDVELGPEVPDGSRVPSSASASEPPPLVADADLGTGPRVVRADSLLGSALRTLLREHRARAATPTPWSRRSRPAARTPPEPPRSPRSDPASASPSSSLARLLSPGATGDGRGILGVASHRASTARPPRTTRPTGFEPPTARFATSSDSSDQLLARIERVSATARNETETPADGIRTRDATDPDDDSRTAAGPGPGSPGFDLRAAAKSSNTPSPEPPS